LIKNQKAIDVKKSREDIIIAKYDRLRKDLKNADKIKQIDNIQEEEKNKEDNRIFSLNNYDNYSIRAEYDWDDIVSKADSGDKNVKSFDSRESYIYCRVSTPSQKEDLERQVEYLRNKYPDFKIIKDIGSGINFKRKGFNSIINSAIKGNLKTLVVTHRDRLCRFGFELIERIIKEFSNGEIMVLNSEKTSPEKELVDDLISIVTVFSSRIYGLRSHSLKKKIKEAAVSKSQDSENTTISN
jgi:predicted site-specific integrase-resolvase